MPFQPINFASIPVQGDPGARGLGDAFTDMMNTAMKVYQMRKDSEAQKVQNALRQQQLEQAQKMAPLDLEAAQIKNQNEPGLMQAQTANAQANANNTNAMTPLQAEKQRRENGWIDKLNQADVNYKNMGGGRAGVGTKAEQYFQTLVGLDNSQLPPEKLYEASNVLRSGGNKLSDGTPLNPMSPATSSALDRLVKMGTTAEVVNQNYKTKGREAELPILNDYISKGIGPYGDTYFGISPALEKDKLKSDDASQIRVGRALAAQQLNFERANLSNAMAMGPAGVMLINEMINAGKQKIENPDLHISNKARQEGMRYYTEALNKAVKARLAVPAGAAAITRPETSEPDKSANKSRINVNWGDL